MRFVAVVAMLAVASPATSLAVNDNTAVPVVQRGFELFDASVATVNGEVLFLSDLRRETCLARCAAWPGASMTETTTEAVRDRMVSDAIVLQEQRKLGLGTVDNGVLASVSSEARKRLVACADLCVAGITDSFLADWARRRLLVRDFLDKRVNAFVDVREEDVRTEMDDRQDSGAAPEDSSEEVVRRDLRIAKAREELKNWFAKATAKARIVLSPLGER